MKFIDRIKEISKKEINCIDITRLSNFFVIILGVLIYINWITMHYAADTYNIMNVGYDQYALRWSLKDGRLFMAAITYFASIINMPINIFVIGNLIIGIVISCLCVIKIRNIVLRNKEKSTQNVLIVTAISFFTIFNFMYIENMYFVEASVMAISLLCFIYAADILVEKNKIIVPTILSIIGIIAYQGTIGFLIAFVFLLTVIKENRDIKKIIKKFIKSCIISGISILFSMILVKIIGKLTSFEQHRLSGFDMIFSNIFYIMNNYLVILKKCCGLFPKYLLLYCIATVFLITIIYDIKNKTSHTIKIFFITVVTVASSFLVSIGTLSSFYTGRLRFCVGALIGMLLIYMFSSIKCKNMKNIVTVLIMIYGVINIFNCLYITKEHKLVNQYEKQEVEEIEKYVENEEEICNKKINQIAVVVIQNQSDKAFFKEINSKSVVTYNSLRCDWAVDGLINFYTGRNLEKVDLTTEQLEKYKEYKSDKGYEIIDNILVLECYIY